MTRTFRDTRGDIRAADLTRLLAGTLSPYIKPAEAGDRGMAEPPHVGNCEPGLAQPGGGSVPPANPASEYACTGLYRGDDHLIDVVMCPSCFGTDDDCGRCAGHGKVVVL